MTYPRFQLARSHKFFTRTAGNLTLNSTSWANLPTIGTTFDVVLAAQVGDTIDVEVKGLWGAEAVEGNLDIASIVSAAVVNYWASNGATGGGWYGPASAYIPIGGSWRRTLLAGDISAGTVTLRPRYRTVTAANKTLWASTDLPFQFFALNLGPADPN